MKERTVDKFGSPVQQSMTMRPEDYVGLNLSRLMLGVILEVYPADDERNRSSYQREDRRGYLHTCTVLVIQDGRGTHMPLENVVITPDMPSGLDDYCERLPRGCSALVTGENWNNQLNHINPYDLDGDWCIVGFMGGSVDQPFIVRWWPHPHNPFDCATSGQSNPNATDEGETLVQKGRMFHRINGVEFTVTKQGHIYVSTYRANSTLRYGSDLAPVDGRFPRELQESDGGSFKMWVKPSQAFELDWNPPVDGMGVLDIADPEIPQTNPSEASASRDEKENTYILIEQDRADIMVPEEFKLLSKQRILLESEEETTLTVGGDFTADVTGDGTITTTGGLDIDVTQAFDLTTTGPASITANSTLDVQVTGATTINSQATLTINATGVLTLGGSSVSISAGGVSGGPGSISMSSAGVDIGSGALGGAVGGTPLVTAFTAFASAISTAQSSATVETSYAAALTAAAAALLAAVQAAVSSTTRVG